MLAVLALSGCATYSAGIAKVELEAGNRNLDGALKSLDELKLTGPDQVLYYLNKGTLLHFQGDYSASNQQFESAKRLMDKLSAISITEQTGSVVVNDTVKAYEGDAIEQLLIYAYEELNYLQSGNFDEAAVEARQFDIKQRLVAGDHPSATYLSGAFVRYLNGMTYEEVGERDSARIDYRKAVEGYQAQSSISGFGVPAALAADLDRLENQQAGNRSDPASDATSQPGDGEVVFILHDGLGPTLSENVLSVPNPDPQHGTAILSVAVPKFVQRPAPVARFEMRGASGSAASEMVEDINALARKSLEDRLPAITARAVSRMVAKNAIAKNVKNQNGDAGTGALLLGMLADVGAIVTERADTRSWSLLPGRILMARLVLPAGPHDLRVIYYDKRGNSLATRDFKSVTVTAGRKVFMSDYYLGPE